MLMYRRLIKLSLVYLAVTISKNLLVGTKRCHLEDVNEIIPIFLECTIIRSYGVGRAANRCHEHFLFLLGNGAICGSAILAMVHFSS